MLNSIYSILKCIDILGSSHVNSHRSSVVYPDIVMLRASNSCTQLTNEAFVMSHFCIYQFPEK